MRPARAWACAVGVLVSGCAMYEPTKEPVEEPAQKVCKATVTIKDIIVIDDTDPAPVNDRWEIEAQVLPGFPPNPGQFTRIVNNVNGNQGARLLNQPAVFGPVVLGPKDARYNLRVLLRGREFDPANENRGQDDTPAFAQDFEVTNMYCPNDAMAVYKFKQLFIDPNNRAETGLLEYSILIDLDP